MSESPRIARSTATAVRLVALAEESELLMGPLEWPEEILCNGATETQLTSSGAGLIKGMLPLLRQRAMEANELALDDLPGTHPDFDMARDVRRGLLNGLLILEALFSTERGREDGPNDSACMHLARSVVLRTTRKAREHLAEREKEVANV